MQRHHRHCQRMPLPAYARCHIMCTSHLLIIICMSLVMKCFGDTVAPRQSLPQHDAHRGYQNNNSNNNNNNSNNNNMHNDVSTHVVRIATIDVRDKIIELQCYAKCGEYSTISNDASTNCIKQCTIEARKLPRRGFCPNMQNAIFQNVGRPSQQLQGLSCVGYCHYDFDCPDVQKCCQSECGPICMPAIGVRDDKLLPEIPKILRCKLPRGHKIEITIASSVNTSFYYHVEARSHIGLWFSPRKLSAWHWQPVEKIAEILDANTKRTDVAFNLKPGRFYQVRVAAINARGFRGYSEPSKAFALPNRPKPPKAPADLQVVSTENIGDFINVKIVWCPSKSNLPVEKYKIIWSLYFQPKGYSFISNESFVKNSHQFVITKLLPDSSYYIQVQAMSISGRRRLKSEVISIQYNTTATTAAGIAKTTNRATQPFSPLKCSHNSPHDFQSDSYARHAATRGTDNTIGKSTRERDREREQEQNFPQKLNGLSQPKYEVRYRMNRRLGMIVQISGFHPHKEKVYELCPEETNCEQREYSAIRAKKNSLEFSKLKYNTTYMLRAFRSNDNRIIDNNRPFTFTTPKCENFSRRFPKMHIQC